MGYRKIPVIHTLELGEGGGFVVRMKGMKIGKMRQVIRLLESDETEISELLGQMISAILEGLVGWNLEDENGVPIEPTAAALDDLELEEVQEILASWLEKCSGPGKELGKDSPSGATFPGQPLTMEAL